MFAKISDAHSHTHTRTYGHKLTEGIQNKIHRLSFLKTLLTFVHFMLQGKSSTHKHIAMIREEGWGGGGVKREYRDLRTPLSERNL